MIADVWPDAIEDELAETIAAAALRERFRQFSCPSWRRIGRRVVEVHDLRAQAAALTIGQLVQPLPLDVRDAIVNALASAIVAAYEDLYNNRIGHSS